MSILVRDRIEAVRESCLSFGCEVNVGEEHDGVRVQKMFDSAEVLRTWIMSFGNDHDGYTKSLLPEFISGDVVDVLHSFDDDAKTLFLEGRRAS